MAFLVFDLTKPEVGRLFDKFTMERIKLGFLHYSANAIFERIRWETNTPAHGPDEFKLGNNFRAFYARQWMDKNQQYNGFFRTRHQNSKDTPAFNGPELGPLDCPYEEHVVPFNIESYL